MKRTGYFHTLKRNSIMVYAAELLPRLGALFIVPLWSSRVSPAEYGRWVLSLTSIEILMGLGNLGIVSYMIKVLYRYHDKRANAYFGMALKMVMMTTTALAILMVCFSRPLSQWMVDAKARTDLFAFLGLYLVCTQFNSLVIIYIQSRIEYGASFVLVLSRWFVNMSFLLYFLLFQHQGFYSWVWASLISELTVLPLSFYYLRHVSWRYFNRRMLDFAFRFSLPTLATQFLGWGQSRIGRYVVSFSGLGTGVGLYGVAQNFSQNYGAMVRPVKVVGQQILGHALEEDAESPYYLEFFHGFACAGLILAFLASLFFRDLMKVIIAPTYWQARAALPPLIFALYMGEVFTLYHSLMFRYFKVWFDFTRTLIAFPTVALVTVALVPWLGFQGAAIAELFGAAVMWIFAHRYTKKITKRSFRFYEKITVAVLAFGVTELAYVLRFSVGLRVMVAIACLTPYVIYYWHQRRQLFPQLTNRLGLLASQPIKVVIQELFA